MSGPERRGQGLRDAPCVARGQGGEINIPEEAGCEFESMELTFQLWLIRDGAVKVNKVNVICRTCDILSDHTCLRFRLQV